MDEFAYLLFSACLEASILNLSGDGPPDNGRFF
jgi:hypothetical protein